MNGTRDTGETTTPDAEDGLDPREAAALLAQTRRSARRQLEVQKPLVMLMQAAAVLGIYGAIWLSVRGQHPYQGPSGEALAIVYAIVAVSGLVAGLSRRRASAGVSGRTRREGQFMGAAVVVAWTAVYVFMGGLLHDGYSHAVIYGVVDAAGPWLMVGAVIAGIAAVKEDWALFALAVAMIGVGTGSAFAGPINVWGVLAVGGCVGLIAKAVAQTIVLRRA